jgi:uncharacterized protein YgbK (DUF1537 family)
VASRALRFGAIADDYTGASDLAGSLAREGARTIQILGRRPADEIARLAGDHDAVVVALKSRAETAAKAVDDSLAVAQALRAAGCAQLYFKYCSTFDSTAQGNIGPVTGALMQALDAPFTIAAPAFPRNGRTQYLGHLFVDAQFLSESPLRDHPRNPMTDPNLVRHLQAQTRRRVGLLAHPVVRAGVAAVKAAVEGLRREGVEIALADAVSDADLDVLAEAFVDTPLLTGGSALGQRLAAAWRRRGLIDAGWLATESTAAARPALVLAGSCSARTLEQLDRCRAAGLPMLPVDVSAVLAGGGAVEEARLFEAGRRELGRAGAVVIHSSMSAAERGPHLAAAATAGLSGDEAGMRLEAVLGGLGRALGPEVGRVVVAGGETSGAVVEALLATALAIGPELAPGVPLCRVVGGPGDASHPARAGRPSLELVLKSGNFGDADFLVRTVEPR